MTLYLLQLTKTLVLRFHHFKIMRNLERNEIDHPHQIVFRNQLLKRLQLSNDIFQIFVISYPAVFINLQLYNTTCRVLFQLYYTQYPTSTNRPKFQFIYLYLLYTDPQTNSLHRTL